MDLRKFRERVVVRFLSHCLKAGLRGMGLIEVPLLPFRKELMVVLPLIRNMAWNKSHK